MKTAVYAQFSSSESQLKTTIGRNHVTLNQNDLVCDKISNDNGTITFKEAGTYFVIASGQVGHANVAGHVNAAVQLCINYNGRDIDNSSCIQFVYEEVRFVTNLVCHRVVEVKAGDTLGLKIRTTEHGVGLVASTPENQPAIPSIVLSLFKVEDAWAQLCRTEKQFFTGEQGIKLTPTDTANQIVSQDGMVHIQEKGTYFVMASGQVAKADEGDGLKRNSEHHSAYLWIKHNYSKVEDSVSIKTIYTDLMGQLVSQAVLRCNAGDTIQVVGEQYQGRSSYVGVYSRDVQLARNVQKNNYYRDYPPSPSMILSIVKVDSAAQFWSNKTQIAVADAKDLTLELSSEGLYHTETTSEEIANRDIINNDGRVTIEKDGFYLVVATGQMGSKFTEPGRLRLWFRKNGKNLENSNTDYRIYHMNCSDQTAILSCQRIIEMKKGDTLTLALCLMPGNENVDHPVYAKYLAVINGEYNFSRRCPSIKLSVVKIA